MSGMNSSHLAAPSPQSLEEAIYSLWGNAAVVKCVLVVLATQENTLFPPTRRPTPAATWTPNPNTVTAEFTPHLSSNLNLTEPLFSTPVSGQLNIADDFILFPSEDFSVLPTTTVQSSKGKRALLMDHEEDVAVPRDQHRISDHKNTQNSVLKKSSLFPKAKLTDKHHLTVPAPQMSGATRNQGKETSLPRAPGTCLNRYPSSDSQNREPSLSMTDVDRMPSTAAGYPYSFRRVKKLANSASSISSGSPKKLQERSIDDQVSSPTSSLTPSRMPMFTPLPPSSHIHSLVEQMIATQFLKESTKQMRASIATLSNAPTLCSHTLRTDAAPAHRIFSSTRLECVQALSAVICQWKQLEPLLPSERLSDRLIGTGFDPDVATPMADELLKMVEKLYISCGKTSLLEEAKAFLEAIDMEDNRLQRRTLLKRLLGNLRHTEELIILADCCQVGKTICFGDAHDLEDCMISLQNTSLSHDSFPPETWAALLIGPSDPVSFEDSVQTNLIDLFSQSHKNRSDDSSGRISLENPAGFEASVSPSGSHALPLMVAGVPAALAALPEWSLCVGALRNYSSSTSEAVTPNGSSFFSLATVPFMMFKKHCELKKVFVSKTSVPSCEPTDSAVPHGKSCVEFSITADAQNPHIEFMNGSAVHFLSLTRQEGCTRLRFFASNAVNEEEMKQCGSLKWFQKIREGLKTMITETGEGDIDSLSNAMIEWLKTKGVSEVSVMNQRNCHLEDIVPAIWRCSYASGAHNHEAILAASPHQFYCASTSLVVVDSFTNAYYGVDAYSWTATMEREAFEVSEVQHVALVFRFLLHEGKLCTRFTSPSFHRKSSPPLLPFSTAQKDSLEKKSRREELPTARQKGKKVHSAPASVENSSKHEFYHQDLLLPQALRFSRPTEQGGAEDKLPSSWVDSVSIPRQSISYSGESKPPFLLSDPTKFPSPEGSSVSSAINATAFIPKPKSCVVPSDRLSGRHKVEVTQGKEWIARISSAVRDSESPPSSEDCSSSSQRKPSAILDISTPFKQFVGKREESSALSKKSTFVGAMSVTNFTFDPSRYLDINKISTTRLHHRLTPRSNVISINVASDVPAEVITHDSLLHHVMQTTFQYPKSDMLSQLGLKYDAFLNTCESYYVIDLVPSEALSKLNLTERTEYLRKVQSFYVEREAQHQQLFAPTTAGTNTERYWRDALLGKPRWIDGVRKLSGFTRSESAEFDGPLNYLDFKGRSESLGKGSTRVSLSNMYGDNSTRSHSAMAHQLSFSDRVALETMNNDHNIPEVWVMSQESGLSGEKKMLPQRYFMSPSIREMLTRVGAAVVLNVTGAATVIFPFITPERISMLKQLGVVKQPLSAIEELGIVAVNMLAEEALMAKAAKEEEEKKSAKIIPLGYSKASAFQIDLQKSVHIPSLEQLQAAHHSASTTVSNKSTNPKSGKNSSAPLRADSITATKTSAGDSHVHHFLCDPPAQEPNRRCGVSVPSTPIDLSLECSFTARQKESVSLENTDSFDSTDEKVSPSPLFTPNLALPVQLMPLKNVDSRMKTASVTNSCAPTQNFAFLFSPTGEKERTMPILPSSCTAPYQSRSQKPLQGRPPDYYSPILVPTYSNLGEPISSSDQTDVFSGSHNDSGAFLDPKEEFNTQQFTALEGDGNMSVIDFGALPETSRNASLLRLNSAFFRFLILHSTPCMDFIDWLISIGHSVTFASSVAHIAGFLRCDISSYDILIVEWNHDIMTPQNIDLLLKIMEENFAVPMFYAFTGPDIHPDVVIDELLVSSERPPFPVVANRNHIIVGKNVMEAALGRRMYMRSQIRLGRILKDLRGDQSIMYQITRRIGSGGFGDVYEVSLYASKGRLAMKRIPIGVVSLERMDQLYKEVAIMRELDHRNVVHLSHISCDKTNLNIFMELCQWSLETIMERGFILEINGETRLIERHSESNEYKNRDSPILVQSQRSEAYTDSSSLRRHSKRPSDRRNSGMPPRLDGTYIIRDVVSAVHYLHQFDIVHRDIKPQNILFLDGIAKLADFGSATTASKSQDSLRTMKGTVPYMAPEVFLSESYRKSCDIWSLGILFAELLNLHLAHFSLLHFPALQEFYKNMSRDKDDIMPVVATNFVDTGFKKHFPEEFVQKVVNVLEEAQGVARKERMGVVERLSFMEEVSPLSQPETPDRFPQRNRIGSVSTSQVSGLDLTRTIYVIEVDTRNVICSASQHQLPASLIELLEGTFHRNPDMRITAEQLLEHPIANDREWLQRIFRQVSYLNTLIGTIGVGEDVSEEGMDLSFGSAARASGDDEW